VLRARFPLPTIVAVRKPKSVIIAADSKPTYRGAPGPAVTCKIYRTGETYFAIEALEHDSVRGFYPRSDIAASFNPSDTFSMKLHSAQASVERSLLRDLLAMKSEDPDAFRWATTDNHEPTIISVIFAEFRDGVPYLGGFGLEFIDGSIPRIRGITFECPGINCSPSGTLVLWGGNHAKAKEFIEHTHGPTEERIRTAIELEIAADPSKVGPPIVVLRIDAAGADWIANESGCPVQVVP
jgi:hypothetical protein